MTNRECKSTYNEQYGKPHFQGTIAIFDVGSQKSLVKYFVLTEIRVRIRRLTTAVPAQVL
jgi:hypothetical protein